jgi:hypothetical protein
VQPRRAPVARRRRQRPSARAGRDAGSGAAAERPIFVAYALPLTDEGRGRVLVPLCTATLLPWQGGGCGPQKSDAVRTRPPDGDSRARAKTLGPETLARAMRHRRRWAVHAWRSRQGVSDRHEPGSAEEEREPKRVHRLIVPVTRRATGAIGAPFPDSLHMHPDSPPGRRRACKPDARPHSDAAPPIAFTSCGRRRPRRAAPPSHWSNRPALSETAQLRRLTPGPAALGRSRLGIWACLRKEARGRDPAERLAAVRSVAVRGLAPF